MASGVVKFDPPGSPTNPVNGWPEGYVFVYDLEVLQVHVYCIGTMPPYGAGVET